jgi:hypothetical protein
MWIELFKLSAQVQASPHLVQGRFSGDLNFKPKKKQSWGATFDMYVSEQQQLSGFLANILIELHKVSDQVQASPHLVQGRFSGGSNFKLKKIHQSLGCNVCYPYF